MTKGDLLLIKFPYTDLNGSKLRPAVVLSHTKLDVLVCFITSQTSWREPTDVLLTPTRKNGLKKLSLVRTSKIATIDKFLAKGLLGYLSVAEMNELNGKLKTLLQLT